MMKKISDKEQVNISIGSCEPEAGLKHVSVKRSLNASRRIILAAAACLMTISLTACGGEDKYALRESAVALYEAGDYKGALEGFNAALEASDGQVSELQFDMLKYKAECQLKLGEYADAKKSYEALLQLDEVKENENSYNEIIKQLDALEKISSAGRLFDSGNYREALEILKEYASLEDGTPCGSIAWYNMAVCEEYLGDYESASEHFSKYLEIYPEDEKAGKEYRFSSTRAEGKEQQD